jgi:hypothetical protein
MNNVAQLSQTAWANAKAIIWNSPLIKFQWSVENKLFIQIQIQKILDQYESFLQDFLAPHKDTQFVILHNQINVLFSDECPLPRKFDRSETHPVITKGLCDSPSKMGQQHFEDNKAAFTQEVTEPDITHAMVAYVFSRTQFIQASPEVKCIIDHFSQKTMKEYTALKVNKSITKKEAS